jgi:hypothetical protein
VGLEYRGVSSLFSHVPVLAAAIGNSLGGVLEIGCGAYSTPLIHWMAGSMNKPVLTIDTDGPWIERVRSFERPWHRIKHVEIASGYARLDAEWGVALVGGEPPDRAACVNRLRHVDFVVVHDTEPNHLGQYPGMERALAEWNHRLDIRFRQFFRNQTTVLSNSVELVEVFGKLERRP